jgi:hypothetical protein
VCTYTDKKDYTFRSFWDRDECHRILTAFLSKFRGIAVEIPSRTRDTCTARPSSMAHGLGHGPLHGHGHGHGRRDPAAGGGVGGLSVLPAGATAGGTGSTIESTNSSDSLQAANTPDSPASTQSAPAVIDRGTYSGSSGSSGGGGSGSGIASTGDSSGNGVAADLPSRVQSLPVMRKKLTPPSGKPAEEDAEYETSDTKIASEKAGEDVHASFAAEIAKTAQKITIVTGETLNISLKDFFALVVEDDAVYSYKRCDFFFLIVVTCCCVAFVN